MKNLFYQALLTLLMTSFVTVPFNANAQSVFVPRMISGKNLPGGGLTTRVVKPRSDKSMLEQLIAPGDSVAFQTCLVDLLDKNGFGDVVDARPAKGEFLALDSEVPDQISSNCKGAGLIIFKPVTVRIDSSNAVAMMKAYPSLAEKIARLLITEAKAEPVTIIVAIIVGSIILGGGVAGGIVLFGGGKGSGSGSGGPATIQSSGGGSSPDGLSGGDSSGGDSGGGSGSGSGSGS